MWLHPVLLVCLINLILVKSEKCDLSESCGGCIGHHKNCGWCSDKLHLGPRCRSSSQYKDLAWCDGEIYNPVIPQPIFKKSRALNDRGPNIVQLYPQEMIVTVRPGHFVNFGIEYRPAQDYPLDVYFLMDNSYTMIMYSQLLQDEALTIYKRLSLLTNNVQLGVGSFVDKPGLPYADPNELTYVFKNHQSLTSNIANFNKIVRDIKTATNMDKPEAGLDALMQAMVCQKELGWRKDARRIIVLFTDDTYHSAGDGKIVGAAKLNDMKCHLENDEYSQQSLYDYPSVSQINKIAKQENMKIFFAAKSERKPEYEGLAKKIKGAKYVELKQHSNIVDMIEAAYKETVRNLKIDITKPSHINVIMDCTKYEDNCIIEHKKTKSIPVSISATSCAKDDNKIIKIKPEGLNEEILIKVEVMCECDCENQGVVNATECSSQGTYQCGICKCNKDRSGDTCECEGNSMNTFLERCRVSKNDETCSNRGQCKCGKCVCRDGYSGVFCQFNDNSCKMVNGKICAGRGRCQYEMCQCPPEWTGDGCQCPVNDATCFAPGSKQVCSGNGVCNCGECKCTKVDSQNQLYTGHFCDACTDCANKRCDELGPYVECVFLDNKNNCDIKYNDTASIQVKMVNATELNAPDYNLAKFCKRILNNGSAILFKYQYDDDQKLHLIIQRETEEPSRRNLWIAIGSTVGVMLLIGIVTVVAWKILMDFHDSREYKKFSKQLQDQGLSPSNQNPMYKEPTIHFHNPTYNISTNLS